MSKSTGPASSHGRCCIILPEKTEGLASVRSRMRTGRKIESTLCVGAGGGEVEVGEEEGRERICKRKQEPQDHLCVAPAI